MVTSRSLNLTRNMGFDSDKVYSYSYADYLQELTSSLPVPDEFNTLALKCFFTIRN